MNASKATLSRRQLHINAPTPPPLAGVHLSIRLVKRLMAAHPSVLPFLVYIKVRAARRLGPPGSDTTHASTCCPGQPHRTKPRLNTLPSHPLQPSIPQKNEDKHIERMAVRAKYMTRDPHRNR